MNLLRFYFNNNKNKNIASKFYFLDLVFIVVDAIRFHSLIIKLMKSCSQLTQRFLMWAGANGL